MLTSPPSQPLTHFFFCEQVFNRFLIVNFPFFRCADWKLGKFWYLARASCHSSHQSFGRLFLWGPWLGLRRWQLRLPSGRCQQHDGAGLGLFGRDCRWRIHRMEICGLRMPAERICIMRILIFCSGYRQNFAFWLFFIFQELKKKRNIILLKSWEKQRQIAFSLQKLKNC